MTGTRGNSIIYNFEDHGQLLRGLGKKFSSKIQKLDYRAHFRAVTGDKVYKTRSSTSIS